ncbi:MFS transporter [Apilactobacillus apisilvae]|uniref:MFS transporter n=1 Tax=Apilactobacillus apisilvae TaxID=2923364 RepID=A0ABY4PHX4_9LACO|nr:MDR family MFS transporter [Apilactobacillus apisilvae]UQS85223.1 MFS transporter [Apilactobacillus apisilvae]
MIKNINNRHMIMLALFMMTFVGEMDVTIVSTAFPSIIGEIHGVSLMNWIFSIFLLTNAVSIPIYGKLSDQFGRKKILIIGLTIFLLGTIFAGISNNIETLIIFRAIQGIGAGSIMPLSYTIIADIYCMNKKSKMIGINGAIWGISLTLAPLLGGLIVDIFNWRWIFFWTVPIILMSIILISFNLNENSNYIKQKVDYLGIIYLSILLFSVMNLIQFIDSLSVKMDETYYLIIISIISFILFIRTEYKSKNPIIPMSLFHNKTFIIQNIVSLLISGFVFSLEIYLPIWIQGIMRLSASISGLVITPISIFWIAGSFLSGWLLSKTNAFYVTITGLTCLLISAILLLNLSIYLSLINFAVISGICGIGFGLTITNSTVISQNIVDNDKLGVATSFNSLSRIIGQTLILSVLEMVTNREIKIGSLHSDLVNASSVNELMYYKSDHQLSSKTISSFKEILLNSLHLVFFVCLLLVVLALIINFLDKKVKRRS